VGSVGIRAVAGILVAASVMDLHCNGAISILDVTPKTGDGSQAVPLVVI